MYFIVTSDKGACLEKIIRDLTEKNINFSYEKYKSLFNLSAIKGSVDCMKVLIKNLLNNRNYCRDLDIKQGLHDNPFILASKKEHIDFIQELCEILQQSLLLDSFKKQAIQALDRFQEDISRNVSIEYISILLNTFKLLFFDTYENGANNLIDAASRGRASFIHRVRKYEDLFDVNLGSSVIPNYNPLMCAIKNKRHHSVEALLEYKNLDLYIKDEKGKFLLTITIENDDSKCFDNLSSLYKDTNDTEKNKQVVEQALIYAIKNNKEQYLKKLTRNYKNFNPYVQDENGKFLLTIAVENNYNHENFKQLLASYSSAKDIEKNQQALEQAVIYAIRKNKTQYIDILTENKTFNPYMQDKNYRYLLTIAFEEKAYDCINKLSVFYNNTKSKQVIEQALLSLQNENLNGKFYTIDFLIKIGINPLILGATEGSSNLIEYSYRHYKSYYEEHTGEISQAIELAKQYKDNTCLNILCKYFGSMLPFERIKTSISTNELFIDDSMQSLAVSYFANTDENKKIELQQLITLAIDKDSIESLVTLLTILNKVNSIIINSNTVLMEYAKNGNSDYIQEISLREGVDYFVVNENGESAFTIATENNNADFLQELLKHCNLELEQHCEEIHKADRIASKKNNECLSILSPFVEKLKATSEVL